MKISREKFSNEQVELLEKNKIFINFDTDYSDEEYCDLRESIENTMLEQGYINGKIYLMCLSNLKGNVIYD